MKDALRLFFFVALALSLLVLWTRWQKWESAAPQAQPELTQTRTPDNINRGINNNDDAKLPVPSQSLIRENISGKSADTDSATSASGGDSFAAITINADWYVAEVSENGGDITSLRLKKHKTQNDEGGEDFPLLRGDGFLAQTGLTDAKGGGGFPYHNSRYIWQNPGGDSFVNDAATIILQAEGGGVVLQKRYIFRRTSYLIEAHLSAQNNGDVAVAPFAYFQLAHDGTEPAGHSALLPTFFGAAVYTDKDKFVKVPFDELGEADYPRRSDDGWIGFIQRYFAVAWLPQAGQHDFFMRRNGRAGVILPFGELAKGAAQTVSARLFAGAQEQDILNRLHEEGTAPGIHLAVDYGWLTFIADFLFKLLAWIYNYVGNWGLAIILLTLTVKLAFYPLSAASYRSMAKMKAEAPRIKQLHFCQRVQSTSSESASATKKNNRKASFIGCSYGCGFCRLCQFFAPHYRLLLSASGGIRRAVLLRCFWQKPMPMPKDNRKPPTRQPKLDGKIPAIRGASGCDGWRGASGVWKH